MGGGRAMTTAAKVAGLGVGKGGFRGGFPPATEQLRVQSAAAASASKPASASISTAVHTSVEDDVVMLQRPVWDDWEFDGFEEEPLPRVVFGKPPTLQEAKEATEDLKEVANMMMSTPKSSSAMEGSNDGGSVSKMLSSFQSSENRAIESAVPQVALQAFAFLSENSQAQTVVASIACDPKVWDAVMENKDLMKFLETNNNNTVAVGSCTEDEAEHSSTTESEVFEEKPKELLEILQDIKLKAVRMMENISSYFGGLFGLGSVTEDGKDKKQTFFNDPRSLFGLAVIVIFMVVLKRA